MARGRSGRMVFDIDPSIKRSFYAELTREGLTAKQWLLDHIQQYLAMRQMQLPLDNDVDAVETD